MAAAQSFATQPEAFTQYPYLQASDTNDISTFLGSVYQNLFSRGTDAAGLTFWTDKIEAGLPLGTAILEIINGAAPADAATLANKVNLACVWHDLAELEPGFSLTPAAITSSRDALARVTSDTASVVTGSDAAKIVEAYFNDPATLSLNATATSLAEDTDTSQRIKVADVTISDDGLGTNELAIVGADATLFELDGTEVFLKAGTALDFENATRLDALVAVDDQGIPGTPDASVALLIDITDANEAPTVSVTQTRTTLSETAETAETANWIKVAEIAIDDDALGTNLLALVGADATLFELDGTDLFLRARSALDFDVDAQLDVTVTVDDTAIGTTPDDASSISLSIDDVNTAPDLSISSVLTTLAEDADTSNRIKIADIVINDDASGTNTLALSGTNAALFELDGTVLFLKAGAAFDFETAASLDVTLSVDDADVGTTPDDSADLILSISDVDEPPALTVTPDLTSLAEDINTASRIKMADIIVTDDAISTATIIVGLAGADAGLFELDNGTLFLRAGAVLDYETNPSLDVTVTLDDPAFGTGVDAQQGLSFTVRDVNEPPALVVTSALTSLTEDKDTADRIKVADVTLNDDALGANILSLNGADAALFELDGSEVFLRGVQRSISKATRPWM